MHNIFFSLFILLPLLSKSQDGYGNQWIFGRFDSPNPSGTILNFNNNTLKIEPVNKSMELESSCVIMCDSAGKLLFYSNGCYIANATHQMMANGDSIGKGYLESSFCKTGGNPMVQGMIALPKPGSDHLYFLFYTDIGNPYYMQPFFPLAPVTLYYSVIDMKLENGLGAVVEKNKIIFQDTFARAMVQAEKHANGKDWWIIIPKSHSNCYWSFLFTESGIDTIFKQCLGQEWGDRDPGGQSAFSPNHAKYMRFNYFYGLNIFDFDRESGLFSNPIHIDFGQDTFYYSGGAFSPNSRFIYACTYNNLWQFDTWASDISASRTLIGELNTPPNILEKTRFNQARLAPDGKIYIAGAGPHKHLHVINRPNCHGLECGLQQYAIELAARNSYTMPNMPHFRQWNESDTCESVSVKTIHKPQRSAIVLYPNPASDGLVLESALAPAQPLRLRFYNSQGCLALEREHPVHTSSFKFDISVLRPGYYIVEIECADGRRHVERIVKGW